MRLSGRLILAGWTLMAFCGCQRFGLNENEALDEDIPYLSIPDPPVDSEVDAN